MTQRCIALAATIELHMIPGKDRGVQRRSVFLAVAFLSLVGSIGVIDAACAQDERQNTAKTATKVIEPYLENADPSLLRNYADQLANGGEADKAIFYARRAVQKQPGNAANHVTLAQALTIKFHGDGCIDPDLYRAAIDEWKYVIQNADSFDRDDALNQLAQLQLDKVKLKRASKHRSRSVGGRIVAGSAHNASLGE